MRRLRAELGVEAMALYHHIPSKDALLDGMVEEVALATPIPELDETNWQDGLRSYARAQLDNLATHPNLVILILSRPAVTERTLRMMETLLESLGQAGFGASQALDIVYALNTLILVHAALATSAGGCAAAARRCGPEQPTGPASRRPVPAADPGGPGQQRPWTDGPVRIQPRRAARGPKRGQRNSEPASTISTRCSG